MFQDLKKHSFIFVIGPQRSRTTIAAKMVSHDTGYQYVDESEVGTDLFNVYKLVEKQTPFVVQCPTLTCYALQLAKIPGAFLVFMQRSREEILASQERIDWTRRYEKKELYFYGLSSGCISDVKKQVWDIHKNRIRNWVEIDASEKSTPLKDHPLWESDRTGFRPKQTERA